MEKEKIHSIQNKLPAAIANMIDSSYDPKIFFNSKGNPFFKDFKNLKKFIKERIEKDIKLIGLKSTKDSQTKEEYLQAKQAELDLCLYALYACELQYGETMFECFPPITDKISQYVYNHRVKNYKEYKQIFEHFAKEIKNNSIFIDDSKLVKNLANDNFGNADIADEKILLDKKILNTLTLNTSKYPVSELVHTKQNGFDYYKRFYVAEYKSKYILFSEVIRVGKNDKKKEKYSYQINIALNGDVEKNRILYRMDYNFGTNHINKILSNKGINAKNVEVDRDLLIKNNVKDCHIHFPRNRYAVIFPNYIHSCDAQIYEIKFNNLESFIEFNHNLIKAESKCLMKDEDKEQLKSNNHKKTIIEFIKEVLKIKDDNLIK